MARKKNKKRQLKLRITFGILMLVLALLYFLDFNNLDSSPKEIVNDYSWLESYKDDRDVISRDELHASADEKIELSEEEEERLRFIEATKESSCLIFRHEDLYSEELNEQVRQIYIKHQLPAETTEYLEELAEKYKEDSDLQDAVFAAMEECSCNDLQKFDFERGYCVAKEQGLISR